MLRRRDEGAGAAGATLCYMRLLGHTIITATHTLIATGEEMPPY